MQKNDLLIRTKLCLPFIRPGLVARMQLQAQILDGLHYPLTLVVAPAGFGKTTLVASSIAGCMMPVAWLSLDKNDNQAGRFLTYLLAALQEVDNRIGNEAAKLMTGMQQVPWEEVLTSLINDLDRSTEEIALVLDDYQYISSQAVHEEVVFLLEHCPKPFHLVIATRSDPPLPLARLRARGQMVELRSADLRFTGLEAAQFLNDIMGLHLDAKSVAALEERTEGWIAGLQMASIALQSHLSMHNCDDLTEFIEGFSGTNRYILDYLLEEVLTSQPPETQQFLLYTSILDRLTAPLCEAVLKDGKQEGQSIETSSSGFQPSFFLSCQPFLEDLERANLFLISLDGERKWFRYHHLFADLLRSRLEQLCPELAPQLHLRAAAWLEGAGIMVEAINHALAAGAHDYAARLVELNTIPLLAQGEINALVAWIEILPVELRLKRPWLCIYQAYAPMLAGRPAEVESLLAQAEASLGTAPEQSAIPIQGQVDKTGSFSTGLAEARSPSGAIAAIRAYLAVIQGKDVEALDYAQLAKELLAAEDLFDQSLAAWAIGKTMLTQGHLKEARLAFEEHIRLGNAMGHIWTLLAGLTYRSQVLQAQGQLHEARATLEEALARASQQGVRNRGYIAWVEDGLASVLYEQNELKDAVHLLAEALVLIRLWPNPNHLIYAYALQARILLAQGDFQGARFAIGEADQVRRGATLTRWLRRTVEADLVSVWLAHQDAGVSLAPTDSLADQAGSLIASWRSELARAAESEDFLLDECAEIAALILARVSLAAGQVEEALAILEPLTRSARAAGHANTAIHSIVLTANAWQDKSAMPAAGTRYASLAFTALEEALCLAEPNDYVRVFLDQGQPMQMLIAQWLAHARPGASRDYAIRLLSQFDAEPQMMTSAPMKTSSTGGLVGPLSQRELEVLHLMALGRTNQAIASQLVVSPGTIKAHTASIYRKLDVDNRTEAVARARQLGILP